MSDDALRDEIQERLAKITPGPWYVHHPRSRYHIRSAQGAWILESYPYGVREEADAEAIAALPRLLAACLARLAQQEAALRAILAEPQGCPMCDAGVLRNDKKEHWDDCPYPKARAALAGAAARPGAEEPTK